MKDKNGRAILTDSETVTGIEQSFKNTLTIPNSATGKYTVKVTATDDDGKSVSSQASYTVDNTAPVTPTVYQVDDNDKKVTGKAEVGSKVTVKVGSTTIGTATTDKYGKYSGIKESD